MKRFLCALMAFLVMLPLAACGNSAGDEGGVVPSDGNRDVLHVAIMTDPEGLDPQKTAATATYFVTTNIFESLVWMDESWEVQPRLAEDWEIADDIKSITFYLKKGVKFHNGREMTAEDVKYSIERLHEDDSAKKKYYTNIVGAEIIDDYTITFYTEKPDAVLLTNFAYPWSVIIPQECADTLKTEPVGTGAYKFVSWVPQEGLKLESFDDYHGDPASIKNVEYSVVPDNTTAMVGLLNGTVDLVDLTGTPIGSIATDPKVLLYQKPINSVTVLGMNLNNPILANETVRQAIACAIDKDEIVKAANEGFGDVVGSYLPSGAEEYIDTTDMLPYDPDHAKELLAEAGYPDGVTIGLTLPKNYPVYANIGQIIADRLERVGIHCEIEMVEWASWMQDVYTDKNYDMTVMANTGRLSSYDFISRFHSQSGDYISFLSGEADDILDELKTELDPDVRKDLIVQFQLLIAEKVPVVPLETQHRIYGMNSSLRGFVMFPSETTEFRLLHFEA